MARCIPLVAAKGKTLKQSIVICSIIYEEAPTKTPKNTNFQKKWKKDKKSFADYQSVIKKIAKKANKLAQKLALSLIPLYIYIINKATNIINIKTQQNENFRKHTKYTFKYKYERCDEK